MLCSSTTEDFGFTKNSTELKQKRTRRDDSPDVTGNSAKLNSL